MSVRTDVVNLNINVNGDKAKDQLNQLRKRSADLSAEMKGLKKNSQEYIDKAKELKLVNDQMAALRSQIGLTALNQKELLAELKRLQALKNVATPQTREFRELQQQIDAVNNRLHQVRTGMFGFKSILGSIKTEIKQFGLLAASYLGFEFLTSQVSNLIGAQKKMADENSDIAKTTSLTTAQIKELNKEFKELDTRTSNSKLRQFAAEAGKLGKDGTADIKKFVEEANMIEVALGEDLGEGAILKIGKLAGIFNESMTDIASGVNAVGQASAASESYQIDLAFRMAGTAKTAKLAAGDVLGYAAALEVNGQTAEVASTALNTFLLDFIANSGEFGKAAGYAKGELGKLINDQGVNVAFLQWLDRLKASSKTTDEFINKMKELGIDGARGSNVLLSLAENTGLVREQQQLANTAIADGTSIVNEYNVKNNNFAAQIDKLSKSVNSFVTSEQFTALVKRVIDLLTALLAKLPGMIQWVKENAVALGLWTAALVANTAVGKVLLTWTVNMVSWVGRLITGTKGLTAAQILQTIAQRAEIVVVSALAAVKALLAGNTAKARQEYQLLTAAMGVNPFTALLVVIGAVVYALSQFGKESGRLSAKMENHLAITKKVSEATEDERVRMQRLVETAKNHTLTLDERKKALDQLIAINPTYLQGLTLENLETKQGIELMKEYVLYLDKVARAKAASDLKSELLKEKMKAGLDKEAAMQEWKEAGRSSFLEDVTGSGKVHRAADKATEANDREKQADQRLALLNKDMEVQNIALAKNIANYQVQLNALEKSGKKETEAYRKILRDKLAAEAVLSNLNGTEGAGGAAVVTPISSNTDRTKPDKKGARDAERAAQRLEKLKEDILRIHAELEAAAQGEDQQEINRVQQKYAKLLQEAEAHAVQLAELTKLQQRELGQLYEKQFERRSKQEYEQSQQSLTSFYAQQRTLADEAYTNGAMDRLQYAERMKTLDRDEANDRLTIALDYARNVDKAAQDAEKYKTDAARKGAEDRKRLDEQDAQDRVYAAQRAVLLAAKGTNAELDARRLLLQRQFELETEFLDKKSELYLLKEAELQHALADLQLQSTMTRIDMVLGMFQQMGDIWTAFNEAQSQREQVKLDKEQKNADANKSQFDKLLKMKLISQKDYDKAVAKIDADMDKKKAEFAEKEAKRQKAQALFAAFINAALGVTQVWSQYAAQPWVAAALTAVHAAMMIAQISKIQAQQVPKARKGFTSATILKGPSHEDSGMTIYNNKTGEPVVEAEGGEPFMILSKRTYGNNKDLIDALIHSSLYNDGARVPWMDNPARINTGRIVPLMRNGGASGLPATGGSSGADMAQTNALLATLITEQRQTREAYNTMQREVRSYVVLQDVTDAQELLDKAKSFAGIRKKAA